MVVSTKLLRIFWPSDGPRITGQGVIIGWQNGDLDVLVVTVLQDVQVGKLRKLTGTLR